MNTIINFFKTQPLYAFIATLVIFAFLYFGIAGLWADSKIAILEHQNAQLQNHFVELQKHADELQAGKNAADQKVAQDEGTIAQQEKDLEVKNALLQAASKNVVDTKKNLDTAVDTANRILADDQPMSHDELKQKLCELYNIPPKACR